ncbi:MAG TPA: hypothetical protein VGL02_03670 [Streptomyces sp.]
MRLRLRRRRAEPQPAPRPRPNYTTIAVLEYDELGIQPQPGTAAALVIGLRALREAATTCTTHHPIETTTFAWGRRRRSGLCARCGRDMVMDAEGEWTTA